MLNITTDNGSLCAIRNKQHKITITYGIHFEKILNFGLNFIENLH